MTEIVLTDEFRKARTARAVPGARWDADKGAWIFDPELDEEATRVALRLFPEIRTQVDEGLVQRVLEGRSVSHRPLAGEADSFAESFPQAVSATQDAIRQASPDASSALYRYQLHDVAYAVARIKVDGGAYLGWDRGLGKTLGGIGCALALGSDRIVVVTPNSSKRTVWLPEFNKWAADKFSGRVYSVEGTAKQRNRVIDEWDSTGGVLLAHYESLRLIVGRLTNVDLVIVDEAHRLSRGSKSSKAPQFYKALMKIKPKYKLALSGSLIINSPEDFFGANHWLFPNTYKSKYRDWCDKYLHYVEGGFGKVLMGVKPDKVKAMQDELGKFILVRSKEDELPGLPDKITQTLRVDLSPEQRRVYDDLAARFIAELPDGSKIVVGSYLAQLTKLRQIATGLDLLGTGVVDSSKIDLALDLIEDNLPKKTVVFAWHKATVHSIKDRLDAKGIVASAITGDTKMAERARLVADFQESPECKVIVATIKTLGESVTLHAAADVIFVESSWTPTDMDQAADRVYRIGQKSHVTITHIVSSDTVDETRILPRLADKEAMRAMVLGATSASKT